jgi:hypothetical protein
MDPKDIKLGYYTNTVGLGIMSKGVPQIRRVIDIVGHYLVYFEIEGRKGVHTKLLKEFAKWAVEPVKEENVQLLQAEIWKGEAQ